MCNNNNKNITIGNIFFYCVIPNFSCMYAINISENIIVKNGKMCLDLISEITSISSRVGDEYFHLEYLNSRKSIKVYFFISKPLNRSITYKANNKFWDAEKVIVTISLAMNLYLLKTIQTWLEILDEQSAIDQFDTVKATLDSLGYRQPIIGFSWDSNTINTGWNWFDWWDAWDWADDWEVGKEIAQKMDSN